MNKYLQGVLVNSELMVTLIANKEVEYHVPTEAIN